MEDHQIADPNRQYVCLCRSYRINEKDEQEPYFYAKAFTLPEFYLEPVFAMPQIHDVKVELENNCSKAAWFFLNKMNFVACVEKIIPFSQYIDLSAQLTAFSDEPDVLRPNSDLDALKKKMQEVAAIFTTPKVPA